MIEIKEYTEKLIEDIKHTDENSNEYWFARELMKVLEYKEWRKFNKVIQKAMEACSGSNYSILDHFVLKDKMVNIGSNTTRKLQDKIKSNEYKRIPIESRNKLNKNEILKPNDLIPNPIRIRNSNNYENISERILQRLILEDIPAFLKELGNGFTFIDNEYKIKIAD